ncbi:MAG: dTDP-4-dehydrorhamnose reductase [Candidatus Liptonbacteria bacterium]|nr:dTDP-4-dehydrorhamnose reductase [Candidatus Liptonbacteria bacterium]
MKILLIGGTGQLGSAILRRAYDFGFEVTAPERQVLDARNESMVLACLKKFKPDVLINTSAYNIVSKCEEEPYLAAELNFVAVLKMAQATKRFGVSFVTYSTDYVFDGEKNKPYREEDCPKPLQTYGVSKLAGEYGALNSYADGTFILRTCGVYGGKTGSRSKGGNFVLNILKEAEGKDVIEVSSEQIANPTYAEHLAEASLRLLKIGAGAGIYHLVNEGYCSWYEFAKKIFEIWGVNRKVLPVDRGGGDGKIRRPKFSVLENVRAKKLGIILPPWEEGLMAYFKFLNLSK